jgi:hypothetical protein
LPFRKAGVLIALGKSTWLMRKEPATKLMGTPSAGGFELEASRDMIGALIERFKTFEMRNMEWQRSITRKTPIWFI